MNATQYEEMLSLLQNIAARIERVEGRLAAIEGAAAHAPAQVHAQAAHSGEPQIADDADLDSQYGNPEIKFDPRRWTGTSYVGAKFSDCPPEYLETLASYLEWKAGESDKKNEMANNGKPRSTYLRKDAARARGWRKRILEGKNRVAARPAAKPKPAPAPADEMDAEMPF